MYIFNFSRYFCTGESYLLLFFFTNTTYKFLNVVTTTPISLSGFPLYCADVMLVTARIRDVTQFVYRITAIAVRLPSYLLIPCSTLHVEAFKTYSTYVTYIIKAAQHLFDSYCCYTFHYLSFSYLYTHRRMCSFHVQSYQQCFKHILN